MIIAKVDLNDGNIIGKCYRITNGCIFRDRVSAPKIYKSKGFYYLLIISGGEPVTLMEIGHSKEIFGKYELNPTGITYSSSHLSSLDDLIYTSQALGKYMRMLYSVQTKESKITAKRISDLS